MHYNGVRKLGESNKSDEEGNERRWEWLMRFSTMQVGPPKHARPTTKTKHLGSKVRVTALQDDEQAGRTRSKEEA